MNGNLGELPLWIQVIVASRAVRRAVLTCEEGVETRILTRALDAMDSCAACGFQERREERALQAASARRGRGEQTTRSVREAAFWAVDACMAAETSRDFPCDGSVTNGAYRAISALCDGGRFPVEQVRALAAADVDVLRPAVQQARLMVYSPVPESLLASLPRVQPLGLAPLKQPHSSQ